MALVSSSQECKVAHMYVHVPSVTKVSVFDA